MSASTDPAPHTLLKEWLMRLSSRPALRPSPLWWPCSPHRCSSVRRWPPRGLSPCGWQTGGRGADAGQGHRHPDPQTGQGEPPDPHQRCGQQLRHQLRANRGQALPFGTAQPMDKCNKGTDFHLRVMLAGTTSSPSTPIPQPQGVAGNQKSEFKRQPPEEPCISWDGGPVTTSLKGVWPDGTRLRDAYSGQEAVVKGGKITLTPSKESGGLLLLEPVKAAKPAPFSWDQASVYFLLTDRFHNGDPANDHSFGRQKDGQDEVATWHGGDFKGLTEKLDYIKQLGINAIWITPWWNRSTASSAVANRELPLLRLPRLLGARLHQDRSQLRRRREPENPGGRGPQARHADHPRRGDEPRRLRHPRRLAGSGAHRSHPEHRQTAESLERMAPERRPQLAWLQPVHRLPVIPLGQVVGP